MRQMGMIWHLGVYLTKLQFSNVNNLFFNMILPIGLLFFQSQGAEAEEMGYFMGAYMTFIVLSTVLFNFGSYLNYYRRAQFFTKYKLLGFSAFGVCGALFLQAFLMQLLSFGLLTAVAVVFKGLVVAWWQIPSILVIFAVANTVAFSIVFLANALLSSKKALADGYNGIVMVLFYVQLILAFSVKYDFGSPLLMGALKFSSPITAVCELSVSVWGQGTSILAYLPQVGLLMGIATVLIWIGNRRFSF